MKELFQTEANATRKVVGHFISQQSQRSAQRGHREEHDMGIMLLVPDIKMRLLHVRCKMV